MPDFSLERVLSKDELTWSARRVVLADFVLNLSDKITLSVAIQFLEGPNRAGNAQTVAIIMHKELALTEPKVPITAQGGLITVNAPFQIFQAASKILGSAPE